MFYLVQAGLTFLMKKKFALTNNEDLSVSQIPK